MGPQEKPGSPSQGEWAPLPPPPGRPIRGRRRPTVVAAIALVVGLLVVGLPTAFFLGRADQGSGGSTSSAAGALGSPSPRIPPVSGLTATAVTGGDVLLIWSASTVADLTGYTIGRDGTTLKFVSPILTRYDDITVQPSQTYSYTIQAFARSGHSEPAGPVRVVTPGPPSLSDARVDGIYEVIETYVSGNITNYGKGEVFDTSWIFTTLCDEGACDVRTHADRGRQSTLHRDGPHYVGTVYAPHGSRCGALRTPLTSTIALTVTAGTFERGVWTATGITGTLRIDVPRSSPCGVGYGTLTLAMTWAHLV